MRRESSFEIVDEAIKVLSHFSMSSRHCPLKPMNSERWKSQQFTLIGRLPSSSIVRALDVLPTSSAPKPLHSFPFCSLSAPLFGNEGNHFVGNREALGLNGEALALHRETLVRHLTVEDFPGFLQ